MEIESSFTTQTRTRVYLFTDWEKATIARCLKPEIKRLEKKIEKIDQDPENEGQADFLDAKRLIRSEIAELKKIINEFS